MTSFPEEAGHSVASTSRAYRARTLCEAFQLTSRDREDVVALRTPGSDVEITWGEYAERVHSIAAGLASLGVERGDAVALMMVHRPEFNLIDSAAIHLGATPFSIYNTSAPEQIVEILANAGARIAVVEEQFIDRISPILEKTGLMTLVSLDGTSGTLSLADLEDLGDSLDFDFEAAWRDVQPADLVTLVYTSGTTGPPKGVELTHGGMLAALRAVRAVTDLRPVGRTLSYLPSAHIADRLTAHYWPMILGTTVTCVADPRSVGEVLQEVRPTFWVGVPRVWERLRGAIEVRVEQQPEPQRSAIRNAIDLGCRVVSLQQSGEAIPEPLREDHADADARVLAGIRAGLGLDQAEWMVVGAAPSAPELLEFFAGLGLHISEVWGMSETCGVHTANPRHATRIGTVGPPLPGFDVRLADDGELLARGGNTMRGYRGQPEETRDAIDENGWLHTGDIAEIDSHGYVRIVDRKKELIINASGKNMSPANIEMRLRSSSPLIGQACVIGDRRPYNVALVVLDPVAATVFARDRGLIDSTPSALARSAELNAAVAACIEQANCRLSRVEQIKRFVVLGEEWTPDSEELTPTMKLKRRAIAVKYAEEIEALYAT